MQKITVLNTKTGKTSEITEAAFNILKASKNAKHLDVIDGIKRKVGNVIKETVKDVIEEVKESIQEGSAKGILNEIKEDFVENVREEFPKVDKNDDGKRSAAEVIQAIKEALSIEDINILIDGDSRVKVLQASQKRKAELTK